MSKYLQSVRKAARAAVISGAALAGLGLVPATAAPPPVINVPCSTAALVDAINTAPTGSILQLALLCTYTLTKPLPTINDMLTFQGPATIARDTSRSTPSFTIMTVGPSGNVVINEVDFLGARAFADATEGGAIDNHGQVQVFFSLFSGNTAETSGGAIYSDGQLIVGDTAFTDNAAGSGGAIEALGNAGITGSSFTGNDANRSGGAIQNDGVTDIDSSNFDGNLARNGGAVNNDAGTMTAIDSLFENNAISMGRTRGVESTPTGGAVDNAARLTLNSDIFDNNGGAGFHKGGAVYNDGTIMLQSSILSGNDAVAGGGFYNDATATLTGDTLLKDDAIRNGGGIYNFDDLTVGDSTLRDDHAGDDGGGIFNDGTEKISESTIDVDSASVNGGGLWNVGSTTLSDTHVFDDTPDSCAPTSPPGC